MYKWEKGTDNEVYKNALQLRKKVFVDEQNVSMEDEMDGKDGDALHVVLYKDDMAAATARLLPKEEGYVLQRFAVLKAYRRQGLGKDLLSEVIKKVQDMGGKYITLHAQDHAIPFYENSGFQVEGEGFMDAGIPHHTMNCEFN